MSDIKKLGSERDSYYSTENPRLSALRDDTRLERVVWRKLDLFILPVVAMFYLLSFLVSVPSLIGFFLTIAMSPLGPYQLWKCKSRGFTKGLEIDEQPV